MSIEILKVCVCVHAHVCVRVHVCVTEHDIIDCAVSLWQETHIGKTVNGLKKRKGVIGSSALNLINSWKQLLVNKPTEPASDAKKSKPKIVVEQCDSPTEGDDDKEVTSSTNHSKLVYFIATTKNWVATMWVSYGYFNNTKWNHVAVCEMWLLSELWLLTSEIIW